MKKARIFDDAGSLLNGWNSGWWRGLVRRRLVADLVAVLGAGGRLLDGFARDVGALGFQLFLLAALLGFVFVTDTFGHAFLLLAMFLKLSMSHAKSRIGRREFAL
jgi:hypothetical protein